MEPTIPSTPTKFRFTFYRFTDTAAGRKTELVREVSLADGMRGLVTCADDEIKAATKRALDWAANKGIALVAHEPFPSTKHPDKVWLEFRFGGLML